MAPSLTGSTGDGSPVERGGPADAGSDRPDPDSLADAGASDDPPADASLPPGDIDPSVAFARVDGDRRIAYAEYGAPDGDPLVFLHGTPGSRLLGALFDGPARRRGVRVLAPDRPGYGRADPWPDRTLRDTGAFVAAVLGDAGVESARLVGFSGGGPHALAAAATRPGRVDRVDVIAGSAPPALASETPAVQRLLRGLAGRAPSLLAGLFRGYAALARRAPSAVVSQYAADASAIDDAIADLVGRDFVAALAHTRRGVVAETRLLGDDWGFPLGAVDCPVRLWHGDADANAPVDGAERLASALPDARTTVFEGVDHLGALLRCRTALFEGIGTGTPGEGSPGDEG